MKHWIGMIALATGLTAASPAMAEIREMKLTFAHIYNPGNIWHEVGQRFTEEVTERTGGLVTFEVLPGGSTGTWRETIEQVQLGVVDLTIQSVGTLNSYDPLPGIEAFPYLIRDIDHFRAVYEGEIGAELYERIAENTGFHIVGASYRGARNLTANREIADIDDLSGLKIRVPGLRMYQMTWELAGASPTPLPAAEIFTGLQQGVIDAQENPLEVIERRRLDEVQTHVILTGHVTGAMTLIFDEDRFKSLPKELQVIMEEAALSATQWGTQEVLRQEETLRAELESRGMTFVEIDREPLQAAVAPIMEEFPELAPWVVRIRSVQ